MIAHPLVDGFNGAATFRLRKAKATGTTDILIEELQWGRNLSVAEGDARPLMTWEQTVLQWGRNLSVAEGAGRGLWPLQPACFNGAATFRLRKARAPRAARPKAQGLQWGRNLSVAEGY